MTWWVWLLIGAAAGALVALALAVLWVVKNVRLWP